MKLSRALWATMGWISLALIFNGWIFLAFGHQKALDFFTGYIIELSLSIDNLFVFYLIFSHFKIEGGQQARILAWGVLGAQLMRAVFILGGVALLKALSWAVYVFGAFLVLTGLKLFFKQGPEQFRPEKLSWLKKIFPQGLSRFMTVLLLVEAADLIFAVDSIPAVLAITKDPFVVYSSNIFAILGLRAMYFILTPFIDKFSYLHYTLGIILTFTGIKMLLDPIWHMPTVYALGFIAVVLLVSISVSFNKTEKRA